MYLRLHNLWYLLTACLRVRRNSIFFTLTHSHPSPKFKATWTRKGINGISINVVSCCCCRRRRWNNFLLFCYCCYCCCCTRILSFSAAADADAATIIMPLLEVVVAVGKEPWSYCRHKKNSLNNDKGFIILYFWEVCSCAIEKLLIYFYLFLYYCYFYILSVFSFPICHVFEFIVNHY